MYDDDDDDEGEIEIEDTSGPASGGYGGDTDIDEEEESEPDPEIARREAAEVARGKEDRAFYDNLAKEEDARHNAMRKDMQARSLKLGEVRQKIRHKEEGLRTLEQKIRIEEDRIDYEKRKAYRDGAKDLTLPIDAATLAPIPILSRDIDTQDIGAEFSMERAVAHIKQLEEEKVELDKELREMLEHMHEEERTLSQLQHQLMHM